MKKSIILLILMLVLTAAIILASIQYDAMITRKDAANGDGYEPPVIFQEQEEDRDGEQKIPAPAFRLYDKDGNEVPISEFSGKPIVLTFWSSWNEVSKEQMPLFQEKFDAMGQEIHFLMVNMTTGQETVEAATAFLDGTEYTFPVYFDTGSPSAAQGFGVQSLPSTYFISADGYRIKEVHGAIDAETLQAGIDLIK